MPKPTVITDDEKKKIDGILALKGNKGKKWTHKQLNSNFRFIGNALRGRKTGKIQGNFKNPLGHKPDFFKKIANSPDLNKALANKKFGSDYRNVWDGMDELFSTSSVRETIAGYLGNAILTKQDTDEMNEVFNIISGVRLKTKYSGFATKDEQMQHPTQAGKGYFADPYLTVKKHTELDTQRKTEVMLAMAEEVSNHNATAASVLREGLKRAISFTLNEFTAPITAENVKKYARSGGNKDDKLLKQVKAREDMKEVFIKLGGKQKPSNAGDSPEQRRGRAWGKKKGDRDVSPKRS